MASKEQYDYTKFKLHISPSQLSTFLSCPRKWWLERIVRLPKAPSASEYSMLFGNVLHPVIERLLQGDDTGRGTDLYPAGWDTGLDQCDSKVLQQLVDKAVEEGVITRQPGRLLESPIGTQLPSRKWMPMQVIPKVGMIGYVDLLSKGRVEDHKTAKTDTYLLSKADLLSDPQCLIYGKHVLETQPDTDQVLLRHNQFVRDRKAPKVSFVEEVASKDIIEDFWKQVVQPCGSRMLEMKTNPKPAEDWAKVEGPQTKDACKAYGGCPFQLICGRQETPNQYKDRIQRILDNPPEVANNEEDEMGGIFDRLAKARAGKEATPSQMQLSKPPTSPATSVAPAAAPAQPQQRPTYEPSTGTPPWANKACRACKGTGFNSKGNPCAGCDKYQEAVDGPTSKLYEITGDIGAKRWAKFTSVPVEEAAPAIPPTEPAEVTEADAEPEPEVAVGRTRTTVPSESAKARAANRVAALAEKAQNPTPPPQEEVKAEDIVGQVEAEAAGFTETEKQVLFPEGNRPIPLEADAKKTALNSPPGEDKAKKGFTMVYGGIRRSKSAVLDLNLIWARYAKDLAERMGVSSYFAIDAFRRRDLMCAAAEEIAGTIPVSAIVTVRANSLDMRSFAEAMEAYATTVIEAVQ